MTTDVKVSVIIPCFNRGDLLRRALESVAAQTMPDFEVIVGDDGSTEDLTKVVYAVGDARVRIARRQVNGGIGAGRNVAVAEARAPMLSFLDSDDEWLPGILEAQLAMLAAHPGASACTTGYELWYSSGRREVRHPVAFATLLDRIVRRPDLSAGSTMMIRAEALRSVGPWREDIRRYEDYEWFLRFALGGHDLVISDHVGARVHSNDAAGLDMDASRASIARILEIHAAALQARAPRLLRALRATFEQELAWAAWRNGARGQCGAHLVRAVVLDPVPRVLALGRAMTARAHWRTRRTPARR